MKEKGKNQGLKPGALGLKEKKELPRGFERVILRSGEKLEECVVLEAKWRKCIKDV